MACEPRYGFVFAVAAVLAGLCSFAATGQGGEMAGTDIEKRIVSFRPQPTSLASVGLAGYPLEGRVAAILQRGSSLDWQPTGIDRSYYLQVMEHIVGEARNWVDEKGAVIDPVTGEEWAHTSPRFASSAAILLHFGRMQDLKETVARAMGYCCERMANGTAKKSSPDFWMRELATAYMCLEPLSDRAQLEQWRGLLSGVRPETLYTNVSPDGKGIEKLHNWAVYSSGGEFLREAAGLCPKEPVDWVWGRGFFEKYMPHQLRHMTDCGMYRDPGDPVTYDITTRLQMATALAFGYDGDLTAPTEELLRRGGLTTLLFVSPEGLVPYGGRSAQFNFQEAIIAALCELEARRYRESDPPLAAAFKRQAHLSALAMKRWMVDMKPFRHIKNGFPPQASHGLDGYGKYSIYSLLTSSFLGLAAIFADDSIREGPTPAELGGYVVAIAPAFHKVFASCGGSCVELDMAADQHYDATGLGRFLVRGVPMELGLGMPCAQAAEKWGSPAISMAPGMKQPQQPVAIGPRWLAGGRWVSLAAMSAELKCAVQVIKESADAVEFDVAYSHDAAKARVLERYRLTPGKLSIRTSVTVNDAPAEKVQFVVPLLVTDGTSRSQIAEGEGQVVVSYLGATYRVAFGAGVTASIEAEAYANRNAVYRSLVLEPKGNEMSVVLSLGR